MVRYLDPEEHPETGDKKRKSSLSPAERQARLRQKNAVLTGIEAIEAAREVALRQLDTRSRSRGELLSAITARGFSDEIAQEVLTRLERVGLVDDEAFARMLVRQRFNMSGKTGRALREDLHRKGLAQDDIDQALTQIDPDDERCRARELVARKMRSMSGQSRDVAYRRLAGMLARKGYSPAVSSSVIRDALEQRSTDDDGDDL
ncbi:regulatory protein RecX [Schaalia vaccimaxillae]|uniref:regulatory protein RecX n=1 Tax=Schaalia vaccimaxillae TaxID=183916 RepID=UPI0003B77976|nr:regulatory protein RecX [Schaalia vaccimaxillae]